jgi:hypothetical protein
MSFKINSDHIRNEIGRLLEGYQKGFPFTKELLQNADDSGAKKLYCGLSDSLRITNKNPLLDTTRIF